MARPKAEDVVGIIFTEMGTIRIRRGRFRSFTYDSQLETPIEPLFILPQIQPQYKHHVEIETVSGDTVRFATNTLYGRIDDCGKRFKVDISPQPAAVAEIRLGEIKIDRVILWESRFKPVTRAKPSEPS